jgi:hypothetical protein
VPNPGQPINLRPETREALGEQIYDLLQQTESDHSEYLESIGTWWDWYDATPLSRVRSDPWPNASNVVIPLIQTFSDAVTARMWGSMHTAKRTWSYKTGNEKYADIIPTVDDFINSESRSIFDVYLPTHDWCFENTVLGSSVLGVFWRRKQAYRYDPRTKKPQLVTISNSPEMVHIPRESMLWERDRSIQESSFVARQCLYTWTDMAAMVQTYGWDREAVEAARGHPGVEGPSGRALDRKREIDYVSPGRSAAQDFHGVWEVWIEWPLAQIMGRRGSEVVAPDMADLGDPAVPIVVDYHRASKQILKVRAHPYYFYRWPFLDMYFQKLPGRGASKGMAKMLEHMQRAATTVVNQSIDRRTLENSIPFITNSPALRNYRFTPMSPIYDSESPDLRQSIMPISLPSQPTADISLMNFVNSVAERVTGIADVNLGRETRLGGHPAPATNTLVQLEEGAKVMTTRLQLARQQLATAAEWLLSMYQQNDLGDQGRLRARLGEADAARLQEMLVDPQEVQFDAYAISNTINPDAERSAAIALTQVSANYYGFVLRMLSIVENPEIKQQQPKVAEAALKAVDAYTESYKRVLTATEIDEVDKFLIEVRENDAAAIQRFGDFASDTLQQRVAAGATAPGAGPGEAPGVPGAVQQRGMGPAGGGAGVAVPVVRGPNGQGY